jgi:electron transfer flavoprotein beta subunit
MVVPVKPVADEGGYIIGSLDIYALSHALAMRDTSGGSVHTMIVGPDAASSVAQRTLATGADETTHLVVPSTDAIDARDIARLLADAIGEIGFDLIVAGQSSDDIDSWLVGPMIADVLGIEHVSTVTEMRFEDSVLKVNRDITGGHQTLRVPIPAMVVVLSGRTIALKYPTPRGLIGARRKPAHRREVETQARSDIAWREPRLPERSGDGEMIVDVPAQEAAKRVVTWLRERGLTG